ncbi:MAG: hypothetical protein QM692_16480 [Thermomicrobiales bacterium]
MMRKRTGRAARQILSGDQIASQPPQRSTAPGAGFGESLVQWYFITLSALLLASVLLWALWGMGPASALLLVLAIGLIGGWLII